MLTVGPALAAAPAEAGVAPLGVGSLPGRLFEDGSVCLGEASTPAQCQKILLTLPAEITKQYVKVITRSGDRDDFFKVLGDHEWIEEYFLSFYGIFDVDNDGTPEVFLDHWTVAEQEVTLLVYKKIGSTYRPYLKLQVPSYGYLPGAWFLAESPVRKAIFRTRYHGSGGGALFYLDFQKRTLHRFTEEFPVWDDPDFGDVDGDGVAEILVRSRAYGVPTDQAALFHWAHRGYRPWTHWFSPSVYVVHARLGAVNTSPRKAIIAVLAPDAYALKQREPATLESSDALKRELAILKCSKGTWRRIATAKLPDGTWPPGYTNGLPTIVQVMHTPQGATMHLTYGDLTLACVYRKDKVTCPAPGKR